MKKYIITIGCALCAQVIHAEDYYDLQQRHQQEELAEAVERIEEQTERIERQLNSSREPDPNAWLWDAAFRIHQRR